MAENTPRMPKGESMKRTDTEYQGKVPSRDPVPGDRDADPRSHAEVARSERRDDDRKRDDRSRMRDDDRVRSDVQEHLDRHQGRRR
jgi:hypothetical protein